MANTKISKHITYKEATHSNTATRRGIKNTPNKKQLTAMKALAKNVFEPMRHHFDKPILINSFFRSRALNKAIGGSGTSQHCKGEAIDLDATKGFTNKQIYNYIKNNLEYDQLIWEFGSNKEPDWVHVSFRADGKNRKQQLRATRKGGKSVYTVIATDSTSASTANASSAPKTGVVKVNTNLNVREKGSVSANIIGKLKNNTKVIVISSSSGWLKVKAGKIEGWVSSKYVNTK